jgi:hypothetical protein
MVTLAPEPGKASGVMEFVVEPMAMATLRSSVQPHSSAPVDAGAGRLEVEAEATADIEHEVRDASHEILASEPIVTPPPVSIILLDACLLTSSNVIGKLQQQTAPKDQGAVGPSSEGILVTPLKWQYAILTKLLEDPMLSSVTLTEFQSTFKELYKFSTVHILH